MKEKATIFDYARMCKNITECKDCPLGTKNNGEGITCSFLMTKAPDKANEIVLKWCEEHHIKTRQSEFLKMFPNAKINPNGFITCCPQKVDKTVFCEGKRCLACMKAYWLAEVDENE